MHARYLADSDVNNDADLLVGMGKVGGMDWVAWKAAFDNYKGDAMQCPSQGVRRLAAK